MKKSKVVLAVVLAVILVIVCVNAPTFSWFTRPQDGGSGEKLMLQTKNTYTAYNGKDVTISTKSSTTGVAEPDSYNTTVSDSAGLSENGNNGINPFNRKYFCTTITNDSGTDQNVSLYARTLSIPTSNNGTLAIGVNGPTRSYHDYSSLAMDKTTANRDMMRIYFEKDNNVSGWNGTEFYICWNEDTNTNIESLNNLGSNGTYTKLTWVGDNNNGNSNRYYADIPITATHAFFCVENWGTNNNNSPNNWQRSQTLWNLAQDGQNKTQSVIYKVTNTSSGGHATVTHSNVGDSGGACINHYYDTIFLASGTFDAALTNDSDHLPARDNYSANYTGTLKYYSGDTSVFTVNENNGTITAISAGTAKLYTKSTGYHTDTQQVETTVTVTGAANYVFNDVPIVKNIKIPASTENNANANVVKVYWYVINNSSTNALTYTIDQVYLGL